MYKGICAYYNQFSGLVIGLLNLTFFSSGCVLSHSQKLAGFVVMHVSRCYGCILPVGVTKCCMIFVMNVNSPPPPPLENNRYIYVYTCNIYIDDTDLLTLKACLLKLLVCGIYI